ncbi:CHAP domain-containing protein [Aneurinibacillus tyrosinisolvens]|uniref:CHAP domain-containing protein n=1 Tax=Aneurinibacillus tyrosinisolvens TaxID=1443435 RepID=UPI00063EE8D7|nr:CHAP domain-containing protein [Aneurinibacillus tyrosinisolvens]
MKIWKRLKSTLLATTLLVACGVQTAFAEEPTDVRPYTDAPYSYTYYGGGNCVWFSWQMAYQKWGIELPHVGDARLWSQLDGTTAYKGNLKYTLKLSDKPKKDSIVIFQPSDLVTYAGQSFSGDFYGHVAWVYNVESDDSISVLESGVYPPNWGEKWHGCWWQDRDYDGMSKLKNVKYLYIDKVENQSTNTTVSGANVIADEKNPHVYALEPISSEQIKLSFNSSPVVYVQNPSNAAKFDKIVFNSSKPIRLSPDRKWMMKEMNGKVIAFY